VHEAVKAGDVKALEALVKEGASVNEVDDTRDRFTPMHWAAYTGALEVRDSERVSSMSDYILSLFMLGGITNICLKVLLSGSANRYCHLS